MTTSAWSMSRRGLLKGSGALTLCFVIPLTQPGIAEAQSSLPVGLSQHPVLNSWLRIGSDGRVTLMIGKVEIGQGILTAVKQVCADELDVAFERITIISGDTEQCPDEGVTAGSRSMEHCATSVRLAAAEVRALLVDLAAEKLGANPAELVISDGVIKHKDGRRFSYGELIGDDILDRKATGKVPLKNRENYRYIGKPVPRIDLEAKVLGEPIFITERRPAGMVHGRVVRGPVHGSELVRVDIAPVESLPGVIKIVRDGSFLGVVAEREDVAEAAATQLGKSATWREPELPEVDHVSIYEWLLSAPAEVTVVKNKMRSDGKPTTRNIEATYLRPYQMHASIGPSAAIATMSETDVVTIESHTQSPYWTAFSIADMLKIPRDNVRLRHVQGSGCYGHNLADDAPADAALLARAVRGRPVRLQYSREDEHRLEPYGAAMVLNLKAELDADGGILDWNYELWTTPHNTRPKFTAGNLLAARSLAEPFEMPIPKDVPAPGYGSDRNAIQPYNFLGQRVVKHFITEMPLRVSALRGLGAYSNVFAGECFIDEIAHATGQDPLLYRLRYLEDARARDVLSKAAEVFGWDSYNRVPGRGRGIAYARYKNLSCYTAVALEVEVDGDGKVQVLRVVAANDSGEIVNPDGIDAQIEGGVIQSLSWSLKEEVRFENGRVQSTDWASYPVLKFSEVPPVEVVQINRPGEPYLGTGEGSQGPTVAALANAIFDASGARCRQLPFTPERVNKALHES